jgi:hypothetical protein
MARQSRGEWHLNLWAVSSPLLPHGNEQWSRIPAPGGMAGNHITTEKKTEALVSKIGSRLFMTAHEPGLVGATGSRHCYEIITLIDPVSLVAEEHKAYHGSWIKRTCNGPAQKPRIAQSPAMSSFEKSQMKKRRTERNTTATRKMRVGTKDTRSKRALGVA